MRAKGLVGANLRKGCRTTSRDEAARPAPDLVERGYTAEAPNRLWVADITYVPTWEGFLCLAVVLDVFSRRTVGWDMAAHLRTELVLSALNMTLPHHRHSPLDCLSLINIERQHARYRGELHTPNVEPSTEVG